VVVEPEEGAKPCSPAGLCVGDGGWPGGARSCAITEMGQTKKEKAIFDNLRMSKRGLGQGRDDAVTSVFYDVLRRLNKQVIPVYLAGGIPDSTGKVFPAFRHH